LTSLVYRAKLYDPITVAKAHEAVDVASRCLASAERPLEMAELGVF
jgi:hypothetical protein